MKPITPQQYVEAIDNLRKSQLIYERSERRAIAPGILGILSTVAMATAERHGLPQEAIVSSGVVATGSLATMLCYGIRMGRHGNKIVRSEKHIQTYESVAAYTIADSDVGRDLAFIAKVVLPEPTDATED